MKWVDRATRVIAKRLRALHRRGRARQGPGGSGAGAWAPTTSPPTPYESWLRANRPNARSRLDLQRAYQAALGRTPSFSVLIPVYRPALWMLEAAIQSVMAQTIDAWELCIVDDGGQDEEVWAYLEDLADRHPRIRVSRHGVNRGISEATNTAAALATADVLVLLDQDDLLDPECLAELALYYAARSEADIVYSDHDKIDIDGKRSSPEFKPGWSPTLLMSHMYLGHVISVRRSLFEAVGGMRQAFDGAQDYDFALRATEQARHVGHVARVLYHWRAIEGSTALSGRAKPESFNAGAEAVRQALARHDITADVVRPAWAVARDIGVFQPEFTTGQMRVGILMPGLGRSSTLRRRLKRLAQTAYGNFEILIGDDGTSRQDAARAKSMLGTRLRLVPVARHAALAERLNTLARTTDAGRIVLLGHDVEVLDPSWLDTMSGYLDLPFVRVVGGRRIADGGVVNAGFVLGNPAGDPQAAFAGTAVQDGGYMQLALVTRDCRAASSDIVMTSLTDFNAVGGLDRARFSDHLTFVDFCIRVAPDGGCVVCGAVSVIAAPPSPCAQERVRTLTAARRWPDTDPFHNRNLSRQGKLFQPFSVCPRKRMGEPVRTTFVSHNLRHEGAPRTLIDLVLALASRGRIQADVLALAGGPLIEACGKASVGVTLLADDDARSVEDQVAAFVQHFAMLGTEVVFANTLRAFPAVLAAARAGLPCVVWQHESEPWQTYFSDLDPDLRDAVYRALQQTYRWTYVAEATRRGWAAVASGHNALTIPNALSAPPPPTRPQARMAARDAFGLAPDDVMILLPGTVCQRKGQRDAVQALRLLDRTISRSVKLFIVGAQPEADYLNRLTADIAKLEDGLRGNVRVVGPAPVMEPYYAAADISLCTSRIESAPRVILEAMSFHLPIISTPVFGISEMVLSGWNAIFYAPGSFRKLASAIERLAADPMLRSTMGARGADVLASRASFSAEVAEYENILLEACLASTDDNPVVDDGSRPLVVRE